MHARFDLLRGRRQDMTKQEFLDSLRVALTGRVSASQVEENIRYYEDYINTRVRMNLSETEVIAELGDPRLLARSISDASKRAERGSGEGGDGCDSQGSYGYNGYGGYADGDGMQHKRRLFHMPLWLVLVLAFVVLILIFGAAFSILSYLAPVLIPVLLIVFVVRWIRSS